MKITDFISSHSQEKKLKKARSASSKEERRNIEEKLFVPEKLPPYTMEEPTSGSDVESKKVTLVFSDLKDVETLSKYFRISEYKGKNIRSSNLGMMIDFLKALESGEIKYDREKRKFEYNTGSTEVRKRERRSEIKRRVREL